MKSAVLITLVLGSLGIGTQAISQASRDSAGRGTVTGITADSNHNFSLRSATIAVYNARDSTRLIAYRLTDNFGKFSLTNLPLDTLVRLVISYIGYNDRIKIFVLDHAHPFADLGKIYLFADAQSLAAVEVHSFQPVRMNHDTLEFNPRAFFLDKNAVVEDLLRRLPGVTVWGDGTISVNGRLVKSVLVDGKPFFGGATRIATQNIPKESVDKIQVYRQNKDLTNPLDSVPEINIKLKKESNHGLFGKIGAGYGTNDRKEADANLNYFTPRSQLALIGAGNNVNKTTPDVSTLIGNSSFKGVGAALDYEPDLRSAGQTRPVEAGFTFQHDFIEHNSSRDVDRLSADYFYARRRNDLLSNTTTTTGLTNASILIQKEGDWTYSLSTRHNFNTRYESTKGTDTYSVLGSLEYNTDVFQNISSAILSDPQGNTLSSNSMNVNANQNDKKGSASIFIGRTAELSFAAGSGNSDKSLNSTFNSKTTGPDQSFNRTYHLDSTWWNSRLFLTTQDWTSLRIDGWKIFNLDLQNEWIIHGRNLSNSVNDLPPPAQSPVSDGYLTATNNYFYNSETPALRLSRGWSASLSSRYVRTFNVNVLLKEQLFSDRNNSTHDFQHFQHTWWKFIPEIRLQRRNYQFGRYDNLWSLKIGTSYSYPTADQLTALADSSDPYHIYKGHPSLRPSEQQELSFNFTHESFKPGHPFNYDLLLKVGMVRDFMTDSSLTSNDGANIDYTVNSNGYNYRYASLTAHLRRLVRLRENTFEFSVSNNSLISRTPSYINSQSTISDGFNNTTGASIGYTLKSLLSIVVAQDFSFYRSAVYGGNNGLFRNSSNSSSLAISWAPRKGWNIRSNIAYNDYASSAARSLTFTMWNASASYRFLKADNAEVRLSAFDLLRENSGYINSGSRNTLVLGKTNALQQYFMLTVSWFPRKFGQRK